MPMDDPPNACGVADTSGYRLDSILSLFLDAVDSRTALAALRRGTRLRSPEPRTLSLDFFRYCLVWNGAKKELSFEVVRLR